MAKVSSLTRIGTITLHHKDSKDSLDGKNDTKVNLSIRIQSDESGLYTPMTDSGTYCFAHIATAEMTVILLNILSSIV